MRFATAIFLVFFVAGSGTADEIDFNRDVRPILSDKCYFCHGPDEANQESGLRLDSLEEASDAIETGELIDRITSDDADTVMPPPESNLSLSAAEKQLIQDWIDQGATYARHWSFEPLPESISVPKVAASAWCKQTLDHFVLEKLEDVKLSPNDMAKPLRWLRRATLDLTGLPPTRQQIVTFESLVARDGEAAYGQTADNLLRSPGFGEHMSVAWLDAARYADSYGYQSDKLNTQWPYRDWVVDAINQNLPYDDFLTWQIAGDLLENPTREQLVATAFNRIHRLNNEGGAVFEEWRLENVADRVHTFGTAVLGLTMECCRCHDHKYDPIPMRDYYALSAFFNSIDESGVYDRTAKVPCPSVLLPTPEQETALAVAKQGVALAIQEYDSAAEAAVDRFETWQAAARQDQDAKPLIPDLRLALAFDRKFDNTLKEIYHPSQSDRSWTSMPELVPVQDCSIARLPSEDADDFKADSETREAPPVPRLAMKLDGERGITAKGIVPFDRWLPMSVVVTMRETKRVAERSLIAHHTRGTDCGYNGWDLTIQDGYLESRLYRVWPGNAIGVRTVDPIPLDRWHQVAATYDGSSTAAGLRLTLDGELLRTTILRDELKKSCNVVVDHGGEFVVGQRFRARGFSGGLIDDVRVFTRNLTQGELRSLATGDPVRPTINYFVSAIDEPSREAWQRLTEARQAVVLAEEVMVEIPVMREMDQPRPAHVLARGEYDSPKNESTQVGRQTLTGLPLRLSEDAPVSRLDLAHWVTDPQHPLTARVAVNRLWGNFFASPLVRTPENFGSQGDLPTHPELLDWLARDFVANGWDVKHFCRQLVLSSTYRQDSAATDQQLALDPTNQKLARGSACRLAAEQIRDLALAASGLLNDQSGGPPVSPYQPGGDLWKESNGMSPPYQQSVGKSLYRRSLYSVWKRTAPLPNMLAFDSTTREVCTVKRSRTNTPLQALVLLNDVQFVEASRALAESLLSIIGDEERIQAAFLSLAGRQADAMEQAILLTLLRDERAHYAANREQAKQLIAAGESEPAESNDVVELAALANVCQAILNLDATVWKR